MSFLSPRHPKNSNRPLFRPSGGCHAALYLRLCGSYRRSFRAGQIRRPPYPQMGGQKSTVNVKEKSTMEFSTVNPLPDGEYLAFVVTTARGTSISSVLARGDIR